MGIQSGIASGVMTASVAHSALLSRMVAKPAADPQVTGVMVQGSVARGDHQAGSDLDLLILLEDGAARDFRSEVIDGILVERHYGDLATLRGRVSRRPSLAYGLRDGRVLYDLGGAFPELVRFASEVLDDYELPESALAELRYWLYSCRVKLVAALEAGDEGRAGLLARINTWKTLEGLWAVNGLPVPSGGAVLSYVCELEDTPPGVSELLRDVCLDAAFERARACCALIEWFLALSQS